MRRSLWIALVALGASLVSAYGCGSMPPALTPSAERREASPPRSTDGLALHPGEKLAAEIRLRGIPAGQLVAAVGQPCRLRDRDVLPVRTMGRSTGLASTFRDVWVDVTSLIDPDTGRPLQTRTHKKWRKPMLIEVEVDEDRFWWRRRRRGKPARTGERDLPGPTHDVQSVLALLRSWRPAVRPEAVLHLLVDRRLWRVELMFRGREVFDSQSGSRAAVRIDGVAQRLRSDLEPSRAKPKAFSLWVADDRDRAPLRFVIDTKHGQVQADLVHYERQSTPERGSSAGPGGTSAELKRCPRVAAVREAVEAER